MESVLQRLTCAIVTHPGHAYVNVARPEPSSSADHRTCTTDHLDPAGAAVAMAGESLPAFPILTTTFDHIRQSAPVVSVHTLEGVSASFTSSAVSRDDSMHT